MMKNLQKIVLFFLITCLGVFSANAQPQQTVDQIVDSLLNTNPMTPQFRLYDPQYRDHLKSVVTRLVALAPKFKERAEKHIDIQCATQIKSELAWLMFSSARFDHMNPRLSDLEKELASNNPIDVSQQSSLDGAWGVCYQAWFFKLDTSYDQMSYLREHQKVPPIQTTFLNQINSPDLLKNHLRSLLYSEISKDGIDHLRELNETLADLTRLILRNTPSNYHFHPKLKEALLDFVLHEARDPLTGFWGERYRTSVRASFIPDLSTTFHMISYLPDPIPDWPKILTTLLSVKDQNAPQGWLEDGQYTNHNNLDVVTVIARGWPFVTHEMRDEIKVEFLKMLSDCIARLLQSDGSFKVTIWDDNVETAQYFGAAFLARIGYFSDTPFWTRSGFPDSAKIKQKIIQHLCLALRSGDLPAGGIYYRNTLKELGESPDRVCTCDR